MASSSDTPVPAGAEYTLEDGILVVRVTDERFVGDEAHAVCEHAKALLREAKHRVVFDLTAVAYLASTGLGALVSMRGLVLAHNGGLAVFGAHPAMAETLRLTHLDVTLNLKPSLDAARDAVS